MTETQTRRPFIAGIVGNVLEWYDFALYGHLSVLISRHFFPEGDRIIATFAVFSVSFFMRPFGALIFSAIGDRHGRRRALSLSILGMAIPTAAIGILPDYAQVGLVATVLLIVLRLLQGMALGGEMGGAVTFVMEHTSANRIGHASSWIQASTCLGLLAGTLITGLLALLLDKASFENWGWRIPFILGIAAAWLGFKIRQGMAESRMFEHARASNALSRNPISELGRYYWRATLTGVAVIAPMTCGFFFLFVYYNSFLMTLGGYESSQSLLIISLGLLLSLTGTLVSGRMADRFGYRAILITTAVALLLTSPFLIASMGGTLAPTLGLYAYFILSLLIGTYCSTAFAAVTGLFPTPIRYSGISISINLASPLFGSTAPLIAASLIERFDAPNAFLIFSVYFSLLWIFALFGIRQMCPDAFRRWGHSDEASTA